jgi:hypothetical protein
MEGPVRTEHARREGDCLCGGVPTIPERWCPGQAEELRTLAHIASARILNPSRRRSRLP